MSYTREAKLLCKKVAAFFTYEYKAAKSFPSEATTAKKPVTSASLPNEATTTKPVTQETLSLITSIAHYLKLLIRIGLEGSLRLERDKITSDGLFVFLDAISTANENIDRPGIRGSLAYQNSDVCQTCRKPIEVACIGFEAAKWHTQCLICHDCNTEVAAPTLTGWVDDEKIPLRVYCDKCNSLSLGRNRLTYRGPLESSSKRKRGFVQVTLLEQFAFLLTVSMVRLAAVIDGWDGISPLQSTEAYRLGKSAVAFLALGPSSHPYATIAAKERTMRSDFHIVGHKSPTRTSFGRIANYNLQVNNIEGKAELETTGHRTLEDIPKLAAGESTTDSKSQPDQVQYIDDMAGPTLNHTPRIVVSKQAKEARPDGYTYDRRRAGVVLPNGYRRSDSDLRSISPLPESPTLKKKPVGGESSLATPGTEFPRATRMDTLSEETSNAEHPVSDSAAQSATIGGRLRSTGGAARSRLSRRSNNNLAPPQESGHEYDAQIVDLLDVVGTRC
jgi:LIM domain